MLADDNQFALGGLRNLIEIRPDLQLVGHASDGLVALQVIKERRPDVAILDVSMPYLGGLAVARLLSPLLTSVRFLALTQHDDMEFVREAFGAGMRGYLLKSSVPGKLNAAIRQVFDGKVYIDPTIVRRMRKGTSSRVIDWKARNRVINWEACHAKRQSAVS